MIVIPRPVSFQWKASGMMLGKMSNEELDVRSMQAVRLTAG